MKCSQCQLQAVVQLGNGALLCVEHYSMFNAAMNEQQANNMAMMNYYRDRINEIFGLPPSNVRIDVPRRTVNSAQVTYNNIKVDRSVVGSINTAQVSRIDIAMECINNNGDAQLGKSLKSLTEAVIKSTELQSKERDQLVEQLAFLAEQAELPRNQRQNSVIQMVLKAIPISLSTVVSLTTLWSEYGPALVDFFK